MSREDHRIWFIQIALLIFYSVVVIFSIFAIVLLFQEKSIFADLQDKGFTAAILFIFLVTALYFILKSFYNITDSKKD